MSDNVNYFLGLRSVLEFKVHAVPCGKCSMSWEHLENNQATAHARSALDNDSYKYMECFRSFHVSNALQVHGENHFIQCTKTLSLD